MFQKTPKQIVYFFIITIPFVLIFFNFSLGHSLKLKLMGFGTWSVSVVRWPVREVQMMFSYRKSFYENQQKKKEISALKAKVIGLEEIIRQDVRLKRLNQYRESHLFSSITAVVVARVPSSWNSALMISKGKIDGIRPGMSVINGDGVIGKVAEVSTHISKVILLNDPGFSVAVINRRSRETALLTGGLSGKCRLSYLAERADIEVGDEIITSKTSTDFPDGILVGVVTKVFSFMGGKTIFADVEPAATLSQIEEVLVIQ